MEKIQDAKRPVIIHHWDTDGICSASLLYKHLKNKAEKIDIDTPSLGNYYLTPEEIEEITVGHHDAIAILDMSLPKENVLKLKDETKADVFIFDHHHQEKIRDVHHINPIAEGKDWDEHPSASWILGEYLNEPPNLLTILGAVGDHETKLKSFSIFQKVSDFLRSVRLSFEDLLKMVDLIDSSSVVGDREGVKKAVYTLLDYEKDPRRILENVEWNRKLDRLKREIANKIKDPPIVRTGKVVFKEIDSKYNIISIMARRIALDNYGSIVVAVNRGFFEDRDQVYVRSSGIRIDLMKFLERAREKGYSAGGRNNVIGIVLPKEKYPRFIKETLPYLRGV